MVRGRDKSGYEVSSYDLRQRLTALDPDSHRLLLLYRDRQCFLRQMVDNENRQVSRASPYLRHMFIAVSDIAAQELAAWYS